MSDPLLRLLVGISIIALSIALLVWHRRAWRRQLAQFGTAAADDDKSKLTRESHSSQANNGSAENSNGHAHSSSETSRGDTSTEVGKSQSPFSVGNPEVLRHYRWQMLQRSITSAGIGLVGVMMILSGIVANPNVFAFGLFFTVLLILAVFCSAMVDAFRTQMFFQKNDQGFRQAKRELLNEYARLQAKQQRASKHGDPKE